VVTGLLGLVVNAAIIALALTRWRELE